MSFHLYDSPPSQSEKLKNAYKNSITLSHDQEYSTKPNTPQNSQYDETERTLSYNQTHQISDLSFHKFSQAIQVSPSINSPTQPLEIEVQPKRRDFASNQEKMRFIQEYTMKKQTELCKNWMAKGSCQFEDTCSFAHGEDELKSKTHLHQNFKTKACKKYFYKGLCNYGNRCQYLHYEIAYQPEYKEFSQTLFQERNIALPNLKYQGNLPLEIVPPNVDRKVKFVSDIQKKLELQRFRELQTEFSRKELFHALMPKLKQERLPFFRKMEFQTPKKIPLLKMSAPFQIKQCKLGFEEVENYVFGGNSQ